MKQTTQSWRERSQYKSESCHVLKVQQSPKKKKKKTLGSLVTMRIRSTQIKLLLDCDGLAAVCNHTSFVWHLGSSGRERCRVRRGGATRSTEIRGPRLRAAAFSVHASSLPEAQLH